MPFMRAYDEHLKPLSRKLRRQMTDAERLLWAHLRGRQILGVQFYSQRPIGPYIVDFYAPAVKLVIEVDGSQHFAEAGRVKDAEREAFLRRYGLKMLRFDNRQVLLELAAVLEETFRACGGR